MVKVAVTELEYRKAKELFTRAAGAGCDCVCAPAAEGALAAAIRAGAMRHVIIGVESEIRTTLHDASFEKKDNW